MDMLEKRDLDYCLFIVTSKPKIQRNNLKFQRILNITLCAIKTREVYIIDFLLKKYFFFDNIGHCVELIKISID